jgi:hypothetical protein
MFNQYKPKLKVSQMFHVEELPGPNFTENLVVVNKG